MTFMVSELGIYRQHCAQSPGGEFTGGRGRLDLKLGHVMIWTNT